MWVVRVLSALSCDCGAACLGTAGLCVEGRLVLEGHCRLARAPVSGAGGMRRPGSFLDDLGRSCQGRRMWWNGSVRIDQVFWTGQYLERYTVLSLYRLLISEGRAPKDPVRYSCNGSSFFQFGAS